jgi:hypothetical protein
MKIDPLRERATRGWERNNIRRVQVETIRRLLVAFAFGLVAATLAVMTIETAVQHIARPTTSADAHGLMMQ